MRLASSLVAAAMLLASTHTFAQTTAPAAKPAAAHLEFATEFFDACFFAGPSFEAVVAALDAKGAVHLPERAGKRADGADTIHGYMLAGPPIMSFMVEKTGSCVAVAKDVDIESAKTAMETFDRATRERWKPFPLELPASDSRRVLATYHYAMSEQMVMVVTLWQEKGNDADTFLSRHLLRR